MKPHRLELENIGPYRGSVTVDFDALGDRFLICGRTGAGKTTIFDSMCYALYGSPPGTRESSSIVSQYASPGEPVSVRFEFGAGRERFRVTRSPAQQAPKKRGEGFITVQTEGILERREGSRWSVVASKQADITERCVRALGLSKDEFTKIVLLPQGEFQRFLEMNTGDRTQILEKLFPVDLHDSVASLARENAKKARMEIDAMERELSELRARSGGDSAASGLAALELATGSADSLERAAERAFEQAQSSHDAARELASRFGELEAAIRAREARVSRNGEYGSLRARQDRSRKAERAAPFAVAARDARARMARETAELERIERAGGESAARRSRFAAGAAYEAETAELLGSLTESIAETRSRIAAFANWKTKTSLAEEARKRAAAENARTRAARLELEAVSRKIAGTDPAAGRPGAIMECLEAASETERLCAERAAAVERRRVLSGRKAKLDEALRAQALERDEAAMEADALSRELGLARAANDAAHALSLASALEEGRPCPVCGSIGHPAPARPDSFAFTVDTEALEGRDRAARDLVASIEAAMKANTDRALEVQAEIDAIADYDPAVSARELSEAHDALAGFKAEQVRLATLSKELELERERESGLRASWESAASLANAANADAESLNGQASEAARAAGVPPDSDPLSVPDPSRGLPGIEAEKRRIEAAVKARRDELDSMIKAEVELSARLSDLRERLERETRETTVAERAERAALEESGFPDAASCLDALLAPDESASVDDLIRELDREETSTATRLSSAESAVAGKEKPDTASAAQALVDARNSRDAAKAAARDASFALRERHDLLSRIEGLSNARILAEERGRTVSALADLLNGDLPGKRLSFKTFVLAEYFRAVCVQATARLSRMSEGRYSLRVPEAAGGRGRVGLDLEVYDAHTGKARSAASLSGGEKFITSISLALGLADVITSKSGGITLDSVFIDEGFGSLDEESLDRALAVLDLVRGERVIGIVSHVAELRARIPSRIEVEKTRSGSTIRQTQ